MIYFRELGSFSIATKLIDNTEVFYFYSKATFNGAEVARGVFHTDSCFYIIRLGYLSCNSHEYLKMIKINFDTLYDMAKCIEESYNNYLWNGVTL